MTGFGSDSRYSRTARARSSSGYFFGATTNDSLHGHQTMIRILRETGGNSGLGQGQFQVLALPAAGVGGAGGGQAIVNLRLDQLWVGGQPGGVVPDGLVEV